ncbi:cysteine desulfurase family protein [Lachnospiraceae bacterium 62-35]
MEVYLDNAATTRTLEEAAQLVVKMMTEEYGNPSARHVMGMKAEQAVKAAAEEIGKTLKVKGKEILFTSGGSESNNMALIGTALANRRAGNHIIASSIEHPSVYNTLSYLEELGFEVTYLKVDGKGHVDMDMLKGSIRPETILVSVMYVNNEVGAVEPVEEIGRAVHEINPHTIFHVDAIQAYGKFLLRPKKQGIQLLSASSHKFHGPKGVGFLYIDEKVKIKPLIYGGGQQKNLRSGTENVPGIAGMALAAREAYQNFEEKMERLYELKDYMLDRMEEVPGTCANSLRGREGAPQIVSISFEGIRSEVLLHALEEKGIYVSSGSACSSNHPEVSGTLKNMGVPSSLLDGTLRFSFGRFNTKEEIDYCIDTLKEILPVLRRYQRG